MLSFEPKEEDLMRKDPRDIKKESILSSSMKFLIMAISLTTGLFSLLFFWYFHERIGDLRLARTVAFTTTAAVSLVYIFSFKSLHKAIVKTNNFFENKYLFVGVMYGFLLIFSAVYFPPFSRLLDTVPLQPFHWILVFGVSLVTALLVEAVKSFRKRPGGN